MDFKYLTIIDNQGQEHDIQLERSESFLDLAGIHQMHGRLKHKIAKLIESDHMIVLECGTNRLLIAVPLHEVRLLSRIKLKSDNSEF